MRPAKAQGREQMIGIANEIAISEKHEFNPTTLARRRPLRPRQASMRSAFGHYPGFKRQIE